VAVLRSTITEAWQITPSKNANMDFARPRPLSGTAIKNIPIISAFKKGRFEFKIREWYSAKQFRL